MSDYDCFRPKREGRKFEEWTEAEQLAVWAAARDYAQQNLLRVPTLSEVERAECYARGSVDYGAKWAYQIERKMMEKA